MNADSQVCARISRRHARTFALASRFLRPRKRRAAFAIYAFCRTADDIVDETHGNVAGAAEQLAIYRERLDHALAGRADDAVFREIAWAADDFALRTAILHELLDGVARDLVPVEYDSWAELQRYCHGVASTVGILCVHIFGVHGPALSRDEVIARAETLGVAMQLTNVLRDVGEDAARGRCYLPTEDLARVGLTRDDVLARRVAADDPRWRTLMQFEIARARALYAHAHPAIAGLEPDARRCAAACAVGYASILDAIEAIGFDTLRRRARVGLPGKLSVLWRAWRLDGVPGLFEPTAPAAVALPG